MEANKPDDKGTPTPSSPPSIENSPMTREAPSLEDVQHLSSAKKPHGRRSARWFTGWFQPAFPFQSVLGTVVVLLNEAAARSQQRDDAARPES